MDNQQQATGEQQPQHTQPNKITCPNCGSSNCFEEATEIGLSYLCATCGFMSNDGMKPDSEQLAALESTTPRLVLELKFHDKQRNICWYPGVISVPNKGMIYPDGTSKEDWKWAYAPVLELPAEKAKEYPIPGKEGEFYSFYLATEKAQYFGRTEFDKAMSCLGLIRE